MTNLLFVLPDFDTTPYAHILPRVEKAQVNVNDLLTLDAVDVAKRAQVPLGEVKKLGDAVLEGLHASQAAASADGEALAASGGVVSTLDYVLDQALGGGIPTGCLTEITGESAVGKTQLLLSLLLAVQLPPPHGLSKSALYISTEAPLQTSRLTQILSHHPHLTTLPPPAKPSLSRIQSTQIHDLEAQDHILRFQVPVVVRRAHIGLVVVDSIAPNYRAELDRSGKPPRSAEALARRSAQMAQLGAQLRNLAREEGIAVVVANQVADRFGASASAGGGGQMAACSATTASPRPASPPAPREAGSAPTSRRVSASELCTDDPLALDHQQRFFTGWGADAAESNMKTPSLGLAWTKQLAARFALVRAPIYDDRAYAPGEDREIVGWRRTLKSVFSAWCAESETAFEIWEGGVRGVRRENDDDEAG